MIRRPTKCHDKKQDDLSAQTLDTSAGKMPDLTQTGWSSTLFSSLIARSKAHMDAKAPPSECPQTVMDSTPLLAVSKLVTVLCTCPCTPLQSKAWGIRQRLVECIQAAGPAVEVVCMQMDRTPPNFVALESSSSCWLMLVRAGLYSSMLWVEVKMYLQRQAVARC